VKRWTALLTGLFVSCAASAVEPYAGVSYVHATYDEDGFPEFNPAALAVRFGAELNPNLAVEGRVGFGLGDDSKTIFGADVALEIDNFYGAYVRAMLPTGSVTPYLLLGYTHGKVTASTFAASASESDSDASYGVGVDLFATKTTAINIEYAKLFEGEGYEVDGVSLGVAFKF